MTPAQIVRERLKAQRISATFTRADEVVVRLGAMQAQDFFGALWAVGLRVRGSREQDIEGAIAERRVVRTWLMRGTLHVVAAADARWMIELLAPRVVAAAAGRLRELGIDDAVVTRARRVLVRHLEGGRRLSRPAAYRTLERAKIGTEGQRGIYLLWRLALDCVLCFGPREGKQQTFVLFDEWLPEAKSLLREEALAELAHRYFLGHGPATLSDLGWWSGLKLTDARLAISLAGKRLVEAGFGGQRAWSIQSPSAEPLAPSSRSRAHLLPAFDEYLVGYADRSAAIAPSHVRQVNAGGGILKPTVLVDGLVVGTWQRRLDRGEVVFSSTLFTPLDETRTRALERALSRYAQFLGLGFRFDGAVRWTRK